MSKETKLSAEDIISTAARKFEEAKDRFEKLSNEPIDGDLETRVQKRTALGMAQIAYQKAANEMNEAISVASRA